MEAGRALYINLIIKMLRSPAEVNTVKTEKKEGLHLDKGCGKMPWWTAGHMPSRRQSELVIGSLLGKSEGGRARSLAG